VKNKKSFDFKSDGCNKASSLLKSKDFLFFTLGENDVVIEESYNDLKNYTPLFLYNSVFPRVRTFDLNQSFTTTHILNNFRSNYED
jgi:hypothetical protein